MKNFIIICIFSFIFSQVVPPDIFNDIDINEIPQNIPEINSKQMNINFKDYSISNPSSLGVFYYLRINSLVNDNFQIKLSELNISEKSYIVFLDKTNNCMYGPYSKSYESTIFTSIMNGSEIIVIYFEPHNTYLNGNFIIESIQSIDLYPYYQNNTLYMD